MPGAGVGHGAYAWLFSFWLGHQDIYKEEQPRLRLALHSGNVAGPVPLPRAILLFAPGLAVHVVGKQRLLLESSRLPLQLEH
jgi:hypothetical protein